MLDFILEISKFTLPGLVVALVVYLMLKSQSDKVEKLKLLELKANSGKDVLPLQMQAYERLALLAHRMSPEHLVPRFAKPGTTVKDMEIGLINTIKQEVEHNVTQQIYVSPGVWGAVKAYQVEFIGVIKAQSEGLDPNSSSQELGTRILQYFINHPEAMSASKVMQVIKADVKTLLR